MLISLITIIVACFVQVSLATDLPCPCGWQKVGSGCYLFQTMHKSWYTAREDCKARGGDLALPVSETESILLSNAANDHNLVHPRIGLFRRLDDKQFVTVRGDKPSYARWAKGEPSFGAGENCGVIYTLRGPSHGFWNDAGCHRGGHYICEIKFPKSA